MNKGQVRVFAPLMKVDEEQRLVYGRITQEELDKAGETMDYETSKPLFEKWSAGIEEASGGQSKGNVRVMHKNTVAGKLTEIEFNDDEKAIDVCAKIVNDSEWEMVKEGCYTGFSVGGKYAKRWTDKVDGKSIKKFTAQPMEVSIVDNPCVTSATFALVKADGTEEEVEFQIDEDQLEKAETTEDEYVPSNEEIAEKAQELAKAADDGSDWNDHIEEAREELIKEAASTDKKGKDKKKLSEDEDADDEADDKAEKVTAPGIKQMWVASDGEAFEKKADAEAHEEEVENGESEASKLRKRLDAAKEGKTTEEVVELDNPFEDLSKAIVAIATPVDEDGKLEKRLKPIASMYDINRFSRVLDDMGCLVTKINSVAKAKGEGDQHSCSPDIIEAMEKVSAGMMEFANEAVTDLMANLGPEQVTSCCDYYCAAEEKNPDDQLAKMVQKLVEDNRDAAETRREEMAKLFDADEAEDAQLAKRFDKLEAENSELKKIAEEAVESMEAMNKKVEQVLEGERRNAPVGFLAPFLSDKLGKDAEGSPVDQLTKLVEELGPERISEELIKHAQANPADLSKRS